MGNFRGVCFAIATAVLCRAFAQNGPEPDWRKANDRGNRYEGFVSHPLRNSFEILSFAAFSGNPIRSADLQVRFFRSSIGKPMVRAREIAPHDQQSFYWMESKPSAIRGGTGDWNDFGPWQTGPILDPGGIELSNLGVAVFLGNPECSSCQIAPAWVYQTANPAKPREYVLWAVPNADMDRVDYSIYRVVDGKEVLRARHDVPPPLAGGTPFRIPIDVSALPEGTIRVYVSGHINALPDAMPALQLSFYHKTP